MAKEDGIMIVERAFADERFKLLGTLISTNQYDALGRMVRIWAHCKRTQGYYLTDAILTAITEMPGIGEKLVEAGLAVKEAGVYRIKGTQGRIGEAKRVKPKPEAGPLLELYDDSTKALLETVTHSAQNAWLKLYEDANWIKREFLKAQAWIEANPQRRPRNSYTKFLGNWLSRSWDRHRKTIPSASKGGFKAVDLEAL